jgi:hypothetical protein
MIREYPDEKSVGIWDYRVFAANYLVESIEILYWLIRSI